MQMKRLSYSVVLVVSLVAIFSSFKNGSNDNAEIVPAGAIVTKITTGNYSFLEGITWIGKNGLYFNDINGSTTGKLGHSVNQIKDGVETTLNNASRNVNGMYFDKKHKQLVVCVNQAGAGYIATMTLDGKYKDTIVSKFNGKNFNMPNDLDVDKQGGIYFTDPTWNVVKPQPINGVYYYSAKKGIRLLIDDMKKPNGIILSPDEKTLYIDDWDGIDIWAYDILESGKIGNKRSFAKLPAATGTNSGADGVAIDTKGNLYVTFKGGVRIFAPDGKTISTIPVPEAPTNCTFGGKNMKTLYISAGKNIYSIELNTIGIR
jgi:gluconolactonase